MSRAKRISDLRLGWLIFAAWALLAQGFAAGFSSQTALGGFDSGIIVCGAHQPGGGAAGGDPRTPAIPGVCSCPYMCAGVAALLAPPPAFPQRSAPIRLRRGIASAPDAPLPFTLHRVHARGPPALPFAV